MKVVPTPLAGAFELELERQHDERGWFARTFSAADLEARGLDGRVAQCSLSFSELRGTLRGLHFQTAPDQEVKLVRCVRGEIYDVIVDLRAGSPTFRRWYAVTLTSERGTALYIPADFAHGFVTLTDGAEVHYQMSVPYVAAAARGVRWNDPALGITWPVAPVVISDRDASFPLLEGG